MPRPTTPKQSGKPQPISQDPEERAEGSSLLGRAKPRPDRDTGLSDQADKPHDAGQEPQAG
jgi:hypothetical protein